MRNMKLIPALFASVAMVACTAADDAASDEVADTEVSDVEAATESVEGEIVQLQQVEQLPEEPGTDLMVSDVTYIDGIVGKVVGVQLTYTGCGEEEIGAYWDGSWMESAPPQIDVHLWHEAGEMTCQMIVERNLQIDMQPLLDGEPQFTAHVFANGINAGSAEVGGAE